LAEAFGIYAIRVDDKNDLTESLQKALDHDGPVLMDIVVTQEENVWPMVPAGAGIHEMIGG